MSALLLDDSASRPYQLLTCCSTRKSGTSSHRSEAQGPKSNTDNWVKKIERFADIEALQKGPELTRLIYEVSETAMCGKNFLLKDQARCTTISTAPSIAKAFHCDGDKEFALSLPLGKASCSGLRSHICGANNQKFLSLEKSQQLYTEAETGSRLHADHIKCLRGIKYKRHQIQIRPQKHSGTTGLQSSAPET